MDKQKIGWIGLGNMGTPMATRLHNAGYELSVYNRSKQKTETFISMGLQAPSSPAALAANSDIIFLMVSDDFASRELFCSENGLLSGTVSGKVFVNMSTISASVSNELNVLCMQRQCAYLDAPVSRSVKQAREGLLVIMAGGDAAIFEKVKPLFLILGKEAIHIGQCGAGNAAKLAINTFLGIVTQGLTEILHFAENMNVRKADIMAILNNSALGSPFVKMKGEALLQDNYAPAFALKHMAKDLRLAKAAGLNSPLGNAAFSSFQEAEKDGLGEIDVIAILKYLQNHPG